MIAMTAQERTESLLEELADLLQRASDNVGELQERLAARGGNGGGSSEKR